jgi:hypothetical protein
MDAHVASARGTRPPQQLVSQVASNIHCNQIVIVGRSRRGEHLAQVEFALTFGGVLNREVFLRSHPILPNHTLTNRIQNQLRNRMQIQLLHQISAMRLNRIQTEIENIRDLLVASTFRDQLQNLPLARGQ